MVVTSYILCSAIKYKGSYRIARKKFIDSLRIYVKGGAGGNGLPKYGGIGGKGGDIYVLAKEGASLKGVLKAFPSKRVSAGCGGNSMRHKILGELGKDLEVEVPVGITVIDEHYRVLGELNSDGSRLLVAHGGPGGAPHSQYLGTRGQAHSITLDLKIIADVGLVGFPNAGKSSLLRAISHAKPKIASYPFTTLRPELGVVQYQDLRQLSLADLPGLIEGAHMNIGLGHRFLKHVERTRLLLLVADVQGFQLSPHYERRSCLDTVVLLNKELELYDETLLDKPAILLVNKMDTENASNIFNEIKYKLHHLTDIQEDLPESFHSNKILQFDDVIPISVKRDSSSVEKVKERIRQVLDFYKESSRDDDESSFRENIRNRTTEVATRMV